MRPAVVLLAAGMVFGAARRGALPREEEALPRHHGRAVLETALALGYGTFWYYRNLGANSQDWELGWNWPSWRRKLTLDAVRFDSNEFDTNAVGHAEAGMVYYQIARGNGLGLPEALASTLAATAVWELVIEYRELPSLNDFVVNTVGGFAIGEPLFQLGLFFRRSARTPPNRVFALVLAPALAINDWLAPRSRPPRDAVNRIGLSRERWHRFVLETGAGQASGGASGDRHRGTQGVLALETDLVMHPGYGRVGTFADWASPGAWSTAAAQARFDGGGMPLFEVRTSTLVAGRYAQDLDLAPSGRVVGSWVLFGLGSAFELWRRQWTGEARDFLGRIGLLGPQVELGARRGTWRGRLSAGGQLDFGMVHALALDDPRGPLPDLRDARGSLRNDGYYFAIGYTLVARLQVDIHAWDVGALWQRDAFMSLDGRDRYQERLPEDFRLSDERVVLKGRIGFRPASGPVRLGAGIERATRVGRLKALRHSTSEVMTAFTAAVVF